MTTLESKIRAVAARAVEVLKERGWHQGAFAADLSDPQCALCLVGAINVAAGLPPEDNDDFGADDSGPAWDVIERVEHLVHHNAGWWNDLPERTAAQVVEVLAKVAAGEGAP